MPRHTLPSTRPEGEPEFAATLNAEAPRVLAAEACASGAWLVHYSTDYVFDGTGNEHVTKGPRPAP
jgi:dTDP-4-dehydrorhamnose reductase